MKPTLTFLFASCLIMLMASYRQANVPGTSIDTVKEPPGQFEIMKWFFTEFPKTYNGWDVTLKEVFYIHGWTEGVRADMVIVDCKKCGFLNRYAFDVNLTYGYGDGVKLTVTQNRDTTDKYMIIKYPKMFKWPKENKSTKQDTIVGRMFFDTLNIPSPRPMPDTIPKPQYQYYYKLMIPINRFNQPLDTIDMVMQRMGKSMTVDQADELRGIVVKQLRDFIGRPVMDSVKVGGKP